MLKTDACNFTVSAISSQVPEMKLHLPVPVVSNKHIVLRFKNYEIFWEHLKCCWEWLIINCLENVEIQTLDFCEEIHGHVWSQVVAMAWAPQRIKFGNHEMKIETELNRITR